MTREEAIAFFKDMNECTYGNLEAVEMAIEALEQEPDTWSLEDAREDFVDDVYNTLDFLPTNDEANQIIDSFDRVTSSIRREPCENCISRQKAKQFLYERLDRLNDDELYDIFSRIIDDMYNELPPVTPKYTDEEIDRAQAVEQAYIDKMVELAVEETKRPKGKWIYKMQVMNNPYTYKCSVCKEWVKDQSKYCPNCGARMTESLTIKSQD